MSTSFTYVGTPQSYVVPLGVTALQIECYAGVGGKSLSGIVGGFGGYVRCTIPVTPGETLTINTGGQGQNGTAGGGTGGYNGGGNAATLAGTYQDGAGGGASDVRQGGTGTGNVVAIAGGGGGSTAYGKGGAGGNPGGNGATGTYAGKGATQMSGGAGGTAVGGASNGSGGGAFTGGAGGSGASGGIGGGGGGGGYYGGGGGAGGNGIAGNPGGGGSSWVGTSAYNITYGNGTHQSGNGVVILTVAASPAPTLLTPTPNAYLDATSAIAFAWAYMQSASGTTQTGYQLREKIGAGVYHYWNGTDLTSTSPVTNSTSTQSASVTGFANGNTYNWSIATVDSNGVGSFASDSTFITAAIPTVSVTAPTGTATTDPVAHIAWTPTVNTGAETAWRAIVYTAAQYGAGGFVAGVGPNAWDSGLQGGAAVSQDSAVLSNATYRAYVQVTQTGGQTSVYAFSGFVINCTPPTTPTLTAVLDATNARNTLTVTAAAGSQPVSVQYTDDSGVTWTPVRNGTLIATGGGNIAVIYDYEAPPLGTRGYRAMSQTALGVPSAWTATANVTNTTPGIWLKDPLTPLSGFRLNVRQGTLTTQRPIIVTEHQPLGSPYAYVMEETLQAVGGGCTIWTQSASDEATVLALLNLQKTLLFQTPDGHNLYIRIDSPRPSVPPYLVASGAYIAHAITFTGQPTP